MEGEVPPVNHLDVTLDPFVGQEAAIYHQYPAQAQPIGRRNKMIQLRSIPPKSRGNHKTVKGEGQQSILQRKYDSLNSAERTAVQPPVRVKNGV